MNLVAIIWSMIASACLTLAAMTLLVWTQRRAQRAHLLFSLAAAGTAGIAFCELWIMRAESPAEAGMALRWGHVPYWIVIVSLVGFVRLYMRAGRPWLAWTVCGTRTLSLVLNFVFSPNLNYREITGLRRVPFLGESVSVIKGIPNPWMLVGQASLLLFLVFLVDVTITIWRRGERRPLLILSSAMLFFDAGSAGQFVLAFWGGRPTPLTPSLFFLGVVVAMAWEMGREATRAAQLADDLRESEAALRTSKKDLQKLAGRLISAQEEELRRLSRELHDDLTQKLAVLAIETGKLELSLHKMPEKSPEAVHTLAHIKDQLIKVSEDVHTISRQLHPTILDDLGLVRALESECAAVMGRLPIGIVFRKENVPDGMSDDIALCLYRVVQEGLRNITAHSGAKNCTIFLKGDDHALCLSVADDGIGFDPLEIRSKPGLGLSSMRERVHLIQGEFTIQSRPGKGATITVCVPLTGGVA